MTPAIEAAIKNLTAACAAAGLSMGPKPTWTPERIALYRSLTRRAASDRGAQRDWLMEQYERTSARWAALPDYAKPVVMRPIVGASASDDAKHCRARDSREHYYGDDRTSRCICGASPPGSP